MHWVQLYDNYGYFKIISHHSNISLIDFDDNTQFRIYILNLKL